MGAASYKFSSLPNINIPRTLMGVECTHPTSFNHGKIIPLFCVPVGPAENYKLYLNSFIRMNQPIFPFFGDVKCFVHSFFVPTRLLWDHQKEFMGENVLSKGPQTIEYKVPAMKYGGIINSDPLKYDGLVYDSNKYNVPVVGSVSHYLGKPLSNPDGLDGADQFDSSYDDMDINLTILKERGYWAIYNEYYRPEQLVDPILIDTTDSGKIGKDPNRKVTLALGQDPVATELTFATPVATCAKMYDYFRSATISPIYSDEPVNVPLGEFAPLAVKYDTTNKGAYVPDGFDANNNSWTSALYNNVIFGQPDVSYEDGDDTPVFPLASDMANGNLNFDAQNPLLRSDLTSYQLKQGTFKTNLVTDLRSAAGINVDTIRYLFGVYNYLYRDSFGTRYSELIQTHFSIKPSIAVLQRPEILHEGSFNLNVSQVLSTNGATAGDLGKPGANSVTANRQLVVNRSFDEWGFVYIMLETKHKRVYSSGVDAFDLRREKFDFYFPEFACIGNKKIKQTEVSVDLPAFYGDAPDAAWGYQEAWAEERYFRNHVSGYLDPRAPSNFAYMSLAEDTDVDKSRVFNADWVYEDREAIKRVLSGGVNGPDYFADFALTGVMAKPMPLYSEPGLIDHIGMW